MANEVRLWRESKILCKKADVRRNVMGETHATQMNDNILMPLK